MKNQIYQYFNKILYLAFGILFITASCDTNDSISDAESANLIQSEAADILEIENIEESIDDMIESLSFDLDQVDLLKNNNSKLFVNPRTIPECATISASISDNTILLTLDFGDACQTEFENVLGGKINIQIVHNADEGKMMIEHTFEDFTFNDKQLEGTVTKERNKRVNAAPSYSIIHKELKITWENNSFSLIKSDRKREWIEGFDNQIWSDNVYLITGNSNITRKNGKTKTILITEALRREAFCKNIVSGKLEITKSDTLSVLDYGDGECDDLATLTIGDIETIIELKRKHR